MNRTITLSALSILAAMAVVSAMVPTRPALPRSGGATLEAPKFRVDPSWPHVPSQWIMGIVSSVTVDSHDHVWVLQRPHSLAPEERARVAPPVLEFDTSGNFIQGWGGPGSGYDWPESEHGIFVEPNGHVWLGGEGDDDQVLEFTRSGKFVKQIGHRQATKGNQSTERFSRPADVFVVEKTRELLVADGYGNQRVIVFDADSGKFKRMWGAFGHRPEVEQPTDAEGPDGPAQFVSPVHAVRVSHDDLVYVADRGGRRVQVFTLAGKYISQVFIGRECHAPDCGNGTTAAGIAFSPDPDQRFLYVANRSQAQVMVFERKTLTYLDSFGQWGSQPGQFGTLHHLAADSKGNLYTAEVSPLKPVNRRAQKFAFVGLVPVARHAP